MNDLDEAPPGRRKLVGAPEVSHAFARQMHDRAVRDDQSDWLCQQRRRHGRGRHRRADNLDQCGGDVHVDDCGATESEDTLASGVTIDELADDLDQAPKVVDGFWSRHWSDFFIGTYTPPTVVGLYDGSDRADTPSCGGQPLEADNASYCPADGSVAWDANLLVDGVDQIGDSWVYLVIAHEWGHAIQDQLEDSLVAVGEELQADCLAAAALYGAAADGE